MLGFFVHEFHFKQNGEPPADSCRFGIDQFREFPAVKRMRHRNQRHRPSDFVRLPVADQVPANVFGKNRLLFPKALRPTFSEVTKPQLIQLSSNFRVDVFCHGDKRHVISVPATTVARLRDPFPDKVEITLENCNCF